MKVKIVSIIDNNTFKAEVNLYRLNIKYKKYTNTHKSYLVHYKNGMVINLGEEVIIKETRPFSKRKRWILNNIKRSV